MASVERASLLGGIRVPRYTFPNFSKIIGERDRGQGIAFYDTMLATDLDMAAFFADIEDDVLLILRRFVNFPGLL